MNSIDLQGSFIQNLMDLGLPAGAAKAIWMPMVLIHCRNNGAGYNG